MRILRMLGIPAMALAGMLMFTPSQAKARVHVGVQIGTRPVYPYGYYDPYYYGYPYGYVYTPHYEHWHRHHGYWYHR